MWGAPPDDWMDRLIMKYYVTRDDYMEQEIIPALGEFADDFDVDLIIDRTSDYKPGHGFFQTTSMEEFWSVVWECML